jgi:hypothetical protein
MEIGKLRRVRGIFVAVPTQPLKAPLSRRIAAGFASKHRTSLKRKRRKYGKSASFLFACASGSAVLRQSQSHPVGERRVKRLGKAVPQTKNCYPIVIQC